MQNLRIYQTANNPVIFSPDNLKKALDSFQKEQLPNKAFFSQDKVSCLWQYVSTPHQRNLQQIPYPTQLFFKNHP